jgi:hypothetical protein
MSPKFFPSKSPLVHRGATLVGGRLFILALSFVLALPQLVLAKQTTLTVTGRVPAGVATQPYSGSVSASGGAAPYTYKIANLPKGLTIDHQSGTITGTPKDVGQFTFTIFATDSGNGHGQADFTVTFNQPPVSISLAPSSVTVTSGDSQQFLPTISNSTNTGVTWTVTGGSISSTGSFTAPKVTSNTTVTVKATSSADPTKTATATVTVSTTVPNPVSMEVLYPPTSQYQPYYADVQQYLMHNSIVSGADFWMQWADIDKGPTSSPQYDFSSFDAAIAPWIGAGKKINVIVWAVSATHVNNATPQYVWNNLGASNATTCAGEKIPNYFQSAFQLPYQAFMAQVIQHLKGNGSIGYIRFGLGRGGEIWPSEDFLIDPCTSTFENKWGWSETTWANYVNAMLNYEGTLKSPKQLMVGLDSFGSDTVPTSVAATAVSLHMAFGNEGMKANDITKYPHCSSDWCDRVPFAVSHHATIFEIYCYDWLLAYDPNYPSYNTYGAAYAAAFAKATKGH